MDDLEHLTSSMAVETATSGSQIAVVWMRKM